MIALYQLVRDPFNHSLVGLPISLGISVPSLSIVLNYGVIFFKIEFSSINMNYSINMRF